MATTAPTFAQIAESTLDDLLNAIPDAASAIVVRTNEGDIVVFTETRMFFIAGSHISVRNFASQPERFKIEEASA